MAKIGLNGMGRSLSPSPAEGRPATSPSADWLRTTPDGLLRGGCGGPDACTSAGVAVGEPATTMTTPVGVGVTVGVNVPVASAVGVSVASGVCVTVAKGAGVSEGPGDGVSVGTGVGVGVSVAAAAVAVAVAVSVGVGVGVSVAAAVAVAVDVAVSVDVGVGVSVAATASRRGTRGNTNPARISAAPMIPARVHAPCDRRGILLALTSQGYA